LIQDIAHDLHLWPDDLRAKIHSRFDLLKYLAASKIRNDRRKQADEENDSIRRQEAEAVAALHGR
jgi:hypothetical protein